MPNDGDLINVSASRLRETAGTFHKASQDTFDLVSNLSSTFNSLINDMSSELHHSPAALQRLHDRWYGATNNLGSALEEVSKNLNTAADNYQGADKSGMPSQ